MAAVARRHDREHEMAAELQRQLLPTALPQPPGLQTAVRYLTAERGAAAGGDFYDTAVLPSGRLGLVIGDVEGHDAIAAVVMGQLRSAIRALAGQVRQPADLVDALRWSWDLLGFERSATALMGRLDLATGDLVMASAGHPPPLILDASGSARLLPVDPAPLLGCPGPPAVDYSTRLGEGDTILLYTDGLLEVPGVSLSEGEEQLRVAAQAAGEGSVEDLCDLLLSRLLRHPRRDDVALLAIRRAPAERE